jgi:hypothetical protein
MEMVYRILWVEDDDNWYRAAHKTIEYLIEDDLGFKLHVTRAKGRDELPVPSIWRTYDIVFMDLSLVAPNDGSDGDGGDIIRSIRDHEVYTDVIFYSQSGPKVVRGRARDLELDGVFCAGRDDNAFYDKVKDVIGNTIRKVQDINALRGLVVAEAGDVDALLYEVIDLHYKKLEGDEAAKFRGEFFRRLEEDAAGAAKELAKLSDAALDAIVGSRLTTANHLWRATVRISSARTGLSEEVIELIKNYQEQVQRPRNELAHCVAMYDERTGVTTLINKRDPDKNTEFTDEWCRDMRRKLVQHRNALVALRETLA